MVIRVACEHIDPCHTHQDFTVGSSRRVWHKICHSSGQLDGRGFINFTHKGQKSDYSRGDFKVSMFSRNHKHVISIMQSNCNRALHSGNQQGTCSLRAYIPPNKNP